MTYPGSPAEGGYNPPNSSMALVSLIAGILGLTFLPLIGSIVAVITGPMARREIADSHGSLGGEGLATAGMVLGWIGIGLGAIGLCIGGVFLVAIPLCALSNYQTQWLAPFLSGLLF